MIFVFAQYIVRTTVILHCNLYTCFTMHSKALRFMSRHFFALVLIACIHMPLFAQIAVGQWRDHLPYNQGVMVADAGDWVFAAGEFGLFQHHKTDGDIIRLSKVSGMSDIGYSAIAWSDENNTLVVAYENTNIDLIQDGQIINVPDIKDKPILGNKIINNIHIKGDFAYLACGFAVVVLDIVKHEVKDTYYIGPEGTVLNVFDVSTSDDFIFACTEEGMYQAQLSGTNLANFENWSRFNDIPLGTYNSGTWFNNRLYANLSVSGANDTIYFYDSGQWFRFVEVDEAEVRSLESGNDLLLVSSGGSVAEYNAAHERQRLAFDYGGVFGSPNHAMTDENGIMWIADRLSGLIRHPQSLSFNFINVNGPSSVSAADISIWDGRCYVASGSLTDTWSNGFNPNGISTYKDNEWLNISPFSNEETRDIRDFIRVLVDPFDSRRTYASSWGWGLLEYYDDELVEWYDTTNSILEDLEAAPGNIRVCGMEVDRNTGTLWIVGSGTDNLLYAKESNGTWFSFNIEAIGPVTLGDVAIDNSGQKWIVAPRGGGLVVFNDNGTMSNTNDDQSIRMNQSVGNGNLASNDVYAIAADLDGEIWLGTNNGISVFYSPESVFSGNNFDAQQILIEQDGYVQYLLENETVTSIAVDGANRKWIGTASAGVFLMSADGTEEIHHFTEINSPLFSNRITSIGIDQLSGEVFIGTDKGIISYKSTATYGTPEFFPEMVYAYPNPVEPDYEGLIAIKGLVTDADVKITDAAGNVVFATIAQGGQAIWDGNKLTGGRAKSGVYLVFAANEDGKETFVTKILFIN